MYRIRYETTRHFLDRDNYKTSSIIETDYIYGDTIEEIKQKCIDFTIENKYTEQLDLLGQINLNKWMINDDTPIKWEKSKSEFNYGKLTDDWIGIDFEDIEIIPKTISFDFENELLGSEKYQSLINEGTKLIDKNLKKSKNRELIKAKKAYERKLKELENDI